MSLAAAPPPAQKHSLFILSLLIFPTLKYFFPQLSIPSSALTLIGFLHDPVCLFNMSSFATLKAYFSQCKLCYSVTHLIPFSPFKVTILGHSVIIGSIHPAQACLD